MRGKGRLPFMAALRAGLPGWPMAVGGALAWGATLLTSAALTLFLRGWAPADMPPPLMIFFFGGAAAFPLALWQPPARCGTDGWGQSGSGVSPVTQSVVRSSKFGHIYRE